MDLSKSIAVGTQEEEGVILPKFKNAVTLDTLVQLGQTFLDKKSTVPTRPHPSAPDKFPINVPVNKMTAPLDKLRDAARFGTEERK